MSHGTNLLLSFAIHEGGLQNYLKLSPSADEFKGEHEQALFETMHSHVLKFGVIPSLDTIETELEKKGFSAILPNPKSITEPPAYYHEKVRERAIHMALKKGTQSTALLLNAGKPKEALNELVSMVAALQYRQMKNRLVNFSEEGYEIIKNELVKQAKGLSSGLKLGWPYLDNATNGLMPGDVLSIIGRPAQGKAQPLDAPVLTLKGWRLMRELRVGDALASPDGVPSKVEAIYPQGVRAVYAINFTDGRQVEACAEHLWEVSYRDWCEPRVVSTAELRGMLDKARYRRRLRVRLFSGQYGNPWAEAIHPWLLGFLLGDGCVRSTSTMFSSADLELVHRVTSTLPDGLEVRHRADYDYAIAGTGGPNAATRSLKKLGCFGVLAVNKRIPPVVFESDYSTRLAVLQGLMDSDGWVQKDGAVYFGSSSRSLLEDVVTLVRSLGGSASGYANGSAWRTNVKLPNPKDCFTLTRKKDRCKATPTHQGKPSNLWAVIDSVVKSRTTETQCIKVSHPSRLYVTSDYTLTHNTFCLLYNALHAWEHQARVPLIVSMEMGALSLTQRLAAMHTHINLTHLKTGQLETATQLKPMLHQLKKAKSKAPFWVVDGALAVNVSQIRMLCMQLNPSAVYIDGAYLLRHENPKISRWEKVTDNAERIKAEIAEDLELPVTISYQFNRAATDKKTKGEAGGGLENIAYTDAIGQLSSVVLGMMQEESVETIKTREISVLKGRDGQVGKFRINWEFEHPNAMDFSQYYEPKVEDLAYV